MATNRSREKPGRCSVYVMHSEGFDGHLRPAHDTAPCGRQLMTNREVSQLRTLIARYMIECRARRDREMARAKRT